MNKFLDFAPSFLLNAAWQIAAVALFASVAARLLRHSPARHRHLLWVAALSAAVALPLSGLLPSGLLVAGPPRGLSLPP